MVTPRPDRPDDDLDRLLRDFYRAETPRPWPKSPVLDTIKLPGLNGHVAVPFAPRPAQPVRQPWALSSRLVLAASLGGLLLGTALLSGQFKGNQPSEVGTNLGPPAGFRIREELVQPPDGPTSLRFEFTDPFSMPERP